MNEILTTILLVVVTNWVSIGELKTKDGKTFSVQEGRLQTNFTAEVKWHERHADNLLIGIEKKPYRWIWCEPHTNTFILKSILGPVVEEKRVEITNLWITNIYLPQSIIYNSNLNLAR